MRQRGHRETGGYGRADSCDATADENLGQDPGGIEAPIAIARTLQGSACVASRNGSPGGGEPGTAIQPNASSNGMSPSHGVMTQHDCSINAPPSNASSIRDVSTCSSITSPGSLLFSRCNRQPVPPPRCMADANDRPVVFDRERAKRFGAPRPDSVTIRGRPALRRTAGLALGCSRAGAGQDPLPDACSSA